MAKHESIEELIEERQARHVELMAAIVDVATAAKDTSEAAKFEQLVAAQRVSLAVAQYGQACTRLAEANCRRKTEWGWLVDSDTNDRLRPATEGERRSSDESEARGENGHILVIEGSVTRRCYVEI